MKKFLKYISIVAVIVLVLVSAVFAGDIDDPYNSSVPEPNPTTIVE